MAEGGIRIRREYLFKVFKDFETVKQIEILLEQIDTWRNIGIDASGVTLDTSTFNVILSVADTDVQKAMETIDNAILEVIDDRAAALIQNGTGITWVYNDGAGTLTGTVSLAPFSTSDLVEGSRLYYTEARVNANRKNNILEYGYQSVTASTTVTKTITVFTGSTANQTITLPTAGTAGRKIEVMNNGTVKILLSGSSVLGELYPQESAEFVDTASDWLA